MEATRITELGCDRHVSMGIGWYTAGALLLLVCMTLAAGYVIVSAPIPTDAEMVRVIMWR